MSKIEVFGGFGHGEFALRPTYRDMIRITNLGEGINLFVVIFIQELGSVSRCWRCLVRGHTSYLKKAVEIIHQPFFPV
jgi:hypothetical protein